MVPLSDGTPYPSLAPLGVDENGRFFGRARKVQRLRELIDDKRIVSVLGPCGVGKTSLVRAGLLATLKAVHEATLETPTGRVVVLGKRAATPRDYPRRDGEPKRAPL